MGQVVLLCADLRTPGKSKVIESDIKWSKSIVPVRMAGTKILGKNVSMNCTTFKFLPCKDGWMDGSNSLRRLMIHMGLFKVVF